VSSGQRWVCLWSAEASTEVGKLRDRLGQAQAEAQEARQEAEALRAADNARRAARLPLDCWRLSGDAERPGRAGVW
jgi:hypothetical protein